MLARDGLLERDKLNELWDDYVLFYGMFSDGGRSHGRVPPTPFHRGMLDAKMGLHWFYVTY